MCQCEFFPTNSNQCRFQLPISVAHCFGLVSRVLKCSRLQHSWMYLIIKNDRWGELKWKLLLYEVLCYMRNVNSASKSWLSPVVSFYILLSHLIYPGSYFCITNLKPLLISVKDSRQWSGDHKAQMRLWKYNHLIEQLLSCTPGNFCRDSKKCYTIFHH